MTQVDTELMKCVHDVLTLAKIRELTLKAKKVPLPEEFTHAKDAMRRAIQLASSSEMSEAVHAAVTVTFLYHDMIERLYSTLPSSGARPSDNSMDSPPDGTGVPPPAN